MSHHCDMDNHANQMNPNTDAYWDSKGYDERPDDGRNGPQTTKTTPKKTGSQILNADTAKRGNRRVGAPYEFLRYNRWREG